MAYMPYYIKRRKLYGMTGFIIEFYEDTNENKPVEEFLQMDL